MQMSSSILLFLIMAGKQRIHSTQGSAQGHRICLFFVHFIADPLLFIPICVRRASSQAAALQQVRRGLLPGSATGFLKGCMTFFSKFNYARLQLYRTLTPQVMNICPDNKNETEAKMMLTGR